MSSSIRPEVYYFWLRSRRRAQVAALANPASFFQFHFLPFQIKSFLQSDSAHLEVKKVQRLLKRDGEQVRENVAIVVVGFSGGGGSEGSEIKLNQWFS